MPKDEQKSRENAIKKLYLLQVVFPIRRLILGEYSSNIIELKNLYIEKFKKKPRDISKALENLNRDQLISLVLSSSIPEEKVNELYEEYKYGVRVSFNLFSYSNKINQSELIKILKTNDPIPFVKSLQNLPLEKTMEELTSDNVPPEEQPDIKNLIMDIERIENIENDFVEIPFTYESKLIYLEPTTRDLARVYELTPGFIWINTKFKVMSIHAKSKLAIDIVIKLFETAFNVKLLNPILHKNIIDEIFDRTSLESGSWFSPEEDMELPRRIRATDQKLFDKGLIKTMEQKKHERISSLYSQNIHQRLKIRVGISQWLGKIYITKTLRTSELRSWAPPKILEVFKIIKEKELKGIKEFIDALKAKGFNRTSSIRRYSLEEKEVLLNIIGSLLFLKQNHQHTQRVSISISSILKKFPKLFLSNPIPEMFCEKCQETIFPVCVNCGNNNFMVDLQKSRLVCDICNRENNIQCLYGHTIPVNGLNDLVILLPSWRFYEIMRSLTNELGYSQWDENDFFHMQGINIKLLEIPRTEKIVYSLDEILEFSPLKTVNIKASEKSDLINELKEIKERCHRGIKANDCANCLKSNKDKQCISKLFAYLSIEQGKIAEYILKPHSGYEFGDVRFDLTVNGNKKTFVGHAKSFPKNRIELRATDRSGGEILRQVIFSLKDESIDVVGVILPLPLEYEFRSLLKWLVAGFKRKIIFIEQETLLKLLKLSKQ